MAKKKTYTTGAAKPTIAVSSNVPITLNGNSYGNYASIGSVSSTNWSIASTGGGGGSYITVGAMPILTSGVKDLRSNLFKVVIGDYDSTMVTTLTKSIEFRDEKLIVSFILDEKDTIREAFTEYHYFRLSYLNTKGEPEEIYEIKTDPIAEPKYILPDVRSDFGDIPNWKLVWSPYTVIRVEKGN